MVDLQQDGSTGTLTRGSSGRTDNSSHRKLSTLQGPKGYEANRLPSRVERKRQTSVYEIYEGHGDVDVQTTEGMI